MEPVARLGGRRSRGKDINWESCLICQESKGGSEHTHKVTEEGLQRFKECVNKRLKYHDTEYVNVLDFLQTTDIGEVQDRIVLHCCPQN